jgi:hypothetical protein
LQTGFGLKFGVGRMMYVGNGKPHDLKQAMAGLTRLWVADPLKELRRFFLAY